MVANGSMKREKKELSVRCSIEWIRVAAVYLNIFSTCIRHSAEQLRSVAGRGEGKKKEGKTATSGRRFDHDAAIGRHKYPLYTSADGAFAADKGGKKSEEKEKGGVPHGSETISTSSPFLYSLVVCLQSSPWERCGATREKKGGGKRGEGERVFLAHCLQRVPLLVVSTIIFLLLFLFPQVTENETRGEGEKGGGGGN